MRFRFDVQSASRLAVVLGFAVVAAAQFLPYGRYVGQHTGVPGCLGFGGCADNPTVAVDYSQSPALFPVSVLAALGSLAAAWPHRSTVLRSGWWFSLVLVGIVAWGTWAFTPGFFFHTERVDFGAGFFAWWAGIAIVGVAAIVEAVAADKEWRASRMDASARSTPGYSMPFSPAAYGPVRVLLQTSDSGTPPLP